MAASEIDSYIELYEEPAGSSLEALRRSIGEMLPDADQGLSYGVPVFRVAGRPVAGFSAAKRWLSYLPHSGEVMAKLADELANFETSKGAVKMPIDSPLPIDVVRQLVQERLAELNN